MASITRTMAGAIYGLNNKYRRNLLAWARSGAGLLIGDDARHCWVKHGLGCISTVAGGGHVDPVFTSDAGAIFDVMNQAITEATNDYHTLTDLQDLMTVGDMRTAVFLGCKDVQVPTC